MSSPSGERLSVPPAEGSPRTSYHRAAPERVLQPTIIPLSRLDQQGRCSSPPASATIITERRASDSTHGITIASNSSQRRETDEPLDVSNVDVAVSEGLVPSRIPLQPFFERCLAWTGSNKMVTLLGVLTLLLSSGALYITLVSYRVAYNTYRLERWRDCQDRPVTSPYISTVCQATEAYIVLRTSVPIPCASACDTRITALLLLSGRG